MNTKKVYWIISGEGDYGTWERVEATPKGIINRLRRERCGGDRWAHAFGDIYETQYDEIAGYDVETGEPRELPEADSDDIWEA